MHAHHINLRKIGIMFLIFTLVFTGISVSLGAPVSYAASSAVYVSSSKGDDINGDGSEATPYATLKTAYTEVSDGGTIYLLDDITLTNNTEVIVPIEAKHVTITTAPGAGKTAVVKRGVSSGKVLFQLNKYAQLTLREIIIDGNSEEIGRAIDGRLFNVYEGSKLTIDEGAILQNSHSQHIGSAIYVNDANAVVEMKGGEIRGNKSAISLGGAIVVDNGAFIMTGGFVRDNTGGGVQFRHNTGRIVLSGEATITGNTSAGKTLNVHLGNNKNLVLNDAFTGEAGITTTSMQQGVQFGQVTDAGLDSIGNLIADSGSILAGYDENKNLVWRLFKNEISQPSTDGEITGTTPTLTGVTEPFA